MTTDSPHWPGRCGSAQRARPASCLPVLSRPRLTAVFWSLRVPQSPGRRGLGSPSPCSLFTQQQTRLFVESIQEPLSPTSLPAAIRAVEGGPEGTSGLQRWSKQHQERGWPSSVLHTLASPTRLSTDPPCPTPHTHAEAPRGSTWTHSATPAQRRIMGPRGEGSGPWAAPGRVPSARQTCTATGPGRV